MELGDKVRVDGKYGNIISTRTTVCETLVANSATKETSESITHTVLFDDGVSSAYMEEELEFIDRSEFYYTVEQDSVPKNAE